MTTLNGIEIPEFSNHDEVLDFVDQHKDKIYLHFLESDSFRERNTILSLVESENNEYNQVDICTCINCGSTDLDDFECNECNED